MDAEQLKEAREMSELEIQTIDKYGKTSLTKLIEICYRMPEALDDIEQLQTENAKLKADADKWTDLINKAGAVGLTEADFFKMVETVKEVMLGPEDGVSCRGVFKS